MQENEQKSKRKTQKSKLRASSKFLFVPFLCPIVKYFFNVNDLESQVKPLIGREREFSIICGWIEKAVADGRPLSVYISGSPGTG